MESNKQFCLGLTSTADQSLVSEKQYIIKDISNIEKVIIQSFKYCQAKNNKNRFLKQKKVQQIKKYQKQLINLIKKKSQQIIEELSNTSQRIIQEEEQQISSQENIQNETLINIQGKIQGLKSMTKPQPNEVNIDLEKIKKMTLQCEEQLQKMEQTYSNNNQQLGTQLVDQIERPFKKYLKCLNTFKRDLKLSITHNND